MPRGASVADALFALAVALAALLVFGLADRWLARNAPPGHVPVGVIADPHLVDMTALYGSFAREAGEGGGLLVHNHQTAEAHAPAQARPWDWLVGRASIGRGGGPRSAFVADRALATVLLALSLTLLLGELVVSRRVRWAGLVAAFTGGSLYWIWAWTGADGPGFAWLGRWLTEMGGLSGLGFALPVLLCGVPHLVLEVVFLGAAFAFVLRSVRRDSTADALGAGLAILLQSFARPYTVPVSLAFAGAVLGREVLRADGTRGRALLRLALACLPVAPMLVHVFRLVRGGGVFSSLDVYHPAPSVPEMIVFFGVPALVAATLLSPRVLAARRILGRSPRGLGLGLLAWGVVNLLLVHGEHYPAPFTVGWEVEAMLPLPFLVLLLALLAADIARPRVVAVGGPVLLAVNALPTLFFALEIAAEARAPRSALFVLEEERAAFAWLESERPDDALTADDPPWVLACHPETAPLAPWLAGVRVWLGHPDHTPRSAQRRAQLESFYGDGRGAAGLAAAGVTHFLWGPRERELLRVPPAVFRERAGAFLETAVELGELAVLVPGAE